MDAYISALFLAEPDNPTFDELVRYQIRFLKTSQENHNIFLV